MKIKLHIFRNGQHEIFLPRTADSQQLADVAFKVIQKFSPEGKKKQLKAVRPHEEEIEVEAVNFWGFTLNGHCYQYGEVYKRVK